MEIITLSGRLYGDCEQKTDKNGNRYIRFKVSCTGRDYSGNIKYTMYRCFCYDTSYSILKNGDLVFLSGDLNTSIRTDDTGKSWINCDVYVKNITKGN
ncbi:MAG: single-stranded DNA-binding protein [Bacteroidales bacterium]|nr:single-stranded DNA-binding protein [Bacteroidales bacterium]